MTTYARPTPPPDVANLAQVRRFPSALGLFLLALAVAAVVHAVVTATRRRRRDVAVARAVGFVRRQIVGAVTTHAVTLVITGLLLGVPLGVAAGRSAWTVLADGLGVAPAPLVPAGALVVLVVTALVAAGLIGIGPAVAAARRAPGRDLRVD